MFKLMFFTVVQVDPLLFRVIHFPSIMDEWRRKINDQREEPLLHGDRSKEDQRERLSLMKKRMRSLRIMLSQETEMIQPLDYDVTMLSRESDAYLLFHQVPFHQLPTTKVLKSLVPMLMKSLHTMESRRHFAQGFMRLFLFEEHLQDTDHYDAFLQSILDGNHEVKDVVIGIHAKEEFAVAARLFGMPSDEFNQALNGVLHDELFSTRARTWLQMRADAIRRRLHGTKAFREAAKFEGLQEVATYGLQILLLCLFALLLIGLIRVRWSSSRVRENKHTSKQKRQNKQTSRFLPVCGLEVFEDPLTHRNYQQLSQQQRIERGLPYQKSPMCYYVPFKEQGFLKRGLIPWNDRRSWKSKGKWVVGGRRLTETTLVVSS